LQKLSERKRIHIDGKEPQQCSLLRCSRKGGVHFGCFECDAFSELTLEFH
jgi:hypothetical protein